MLSVPVRIAASLLVELVLAPAASRAQNVLVNPDFNSSVTAWSAPTGALAFGAAGDVDGCAGSGVAVGSTPVFVGGQWTLEIAASGSCLAVQPADLIHMNARLRLSAVIGNTDFAFETYTDSACTTGALVTPTVGYTALPTGIWFDFRTGGAPPPGVQSVKFFMRFRDPANPNFQVALDRTYLGLLDPVFLDDFEAGSTCRASAVAP
ncbi:MAG: hypothetical protein ABIV06_06545 [Thermoanaerobaculia bacterium]